MNSKPCIRLIPLEDEHIYHYMSLSDDHELIDTMGWKPFLPYEKDRFLQFTQVVSVPGLDETRAVVFSIISPDGKAIGYTSIKGINDAEGRAEVGIAVVSRGLEPVGRHEGGVVVVATAGVLQLGEGLHGDPRRERHGRVQVELHLDLVGVRMGDDHAAGVNHHNQGALLELQVLQQDLVEALEVDIGDQHILVERQAEREGWLAGQQRGVGV